MVERARFEDAFPFQDDVLALPVTSVDDAAEYYTERFGMTQVERTDSPTPTVVLERDGVRIGFAENGGDSTQDGAAILVADLAGIRRELESRGIETANHRVDERDGQRFEVFFVVAPDGLCYYFHEPITAEQTPP